jgi:hypothetical protein
VNHIDGVDQFWTETWIPGTMEMIVNNLDNVKKISCRELCHGSVRPRPRAHEFRRVPRRRGFMRVIPIQSAIDGESRKASYEEISTYLEENTIFSVSPCSCRTDREIMGEGCGTSKRICAFRWATRRSITSVPAGAVRSRARKPTKFSSGPKKTA